MVIPLFPFLGQKSQKNYKTLQNFSKILKTKLKKDK